MVYTLKQWLYEHWQPKKGGWVYVAQIFVGLFFLGAAMLKFNSYFITLKGDLGTHLQHWINSGLTPGWYAWLATHIAIPHSKIVAGVIIVSQGVAGFLLTTNNYVKTAAVVLFGVQLNILFGTFLSLDFTEFVGISLWLAVFFAFKPEKLANYNKKIWIILTVILSVFCLIQSYNTYQLGDHNIAYYWGKVSYLQQDVMSIHPFIKQSILSGIHIQHIAYLWVSIWYIRVLLGVLLLTRWRLQAGCCLIVFWMFTNAIWTNAGASQNALWLLTLFVFVAMEQFMQLQKVVNQT